MDDENVKNQLLSMMAEAHAVPADAMEDEWDEWRATPESESALESATLGDLEPAQTQFVEHLARAGLLGSNEHASIDAPLVSEAGYRSMPHGAGRGARVHPRSHRWPQPKKHMIDTPHPLGGVLGRHGAYVYRSGENAGDAYEDELFVVSGRADADPEAVFGVDDRRRAMAERAFVGSLKRNESAGGRAAFGADDRQRAMAERAFLDTLERNEPALGAFGAPEPDAMDYLERLVMEEDPYASRIGEGFADEEGAEAPAPIGAHFGRYFFVKMLAAFLRRHQQNTATMENHGNEIGKAVAEAVSKMDRLGRGRERFPETAAQQRYRRNAVVQLLVRMLGAVAPETTDYMQQRATELYEFLRTATTDPYYTMASESADEHLEAIGADGSYRRLRGALGRAKRFGHGVQKKARATANLRDRAGIVNGIVNVVKSLVPAPGSETGMSATQLDFSAKTSKYVERLRDSIRVHPGMSTGLVDLVVGAVKRYVISDQFKYSPPEIPTLARAGMRELEPVLGGRPMPSIPIESQLALRDPAPARGLPVSDAAKRMAVDLLAHAEGYLNRNPTHVGRAAEGVFSLLVPENGEVMAKVSEQLRAGGRAAKDEYVANALVTHHPHDGLKEDHVLALSGMLFHLRENSLNTEGSGGQSKVLSQVVRVGSKDRTAHDDPWDAEARNAGGAIVGRSDRHRMLCRVGTPVQLGLQAGAKSVEVIPLFYDVPDKKTRV